ncbi:holo-ACP synthase [bacterium]|nr:holo-ACP synthase [bacterium]
MEIGIDIIEIDRIRNSLRNPRFSERILTEKERYYCKREEQIAGRFSAKEAIMKALGKRVPWKDIEILNEEDGHPVVNLYGKAKEIAGGRQIVISISHSRTHAVAVALLI